MVNSDGKKEMRVRDEILGLLTLFLFIFVNGFGSMCPSREFSHHFNSLFFESVYLLLHGVLDLELFLLDVLGLDLLFLGFEFFLQKILQFFLELLMAQEQHSEGAVLFN